MHTFHSYINDTISHRKIILAYGWSDFFPGESPDTLQYQHKNFTQNGRQYITSGNTYILSCYFYNMTSSEPGAAVSFEVSSGNLLMEFCSCSNCQKTNGGSGGAVAVQEGSFIMHKVCGMKCESKHNCAFLLSSASPINTVFDCSIANCFALEWYTMYHNIGNANITRANISNNICARTSAIYCSPNQPFSNEIKIGNIICYCSIANNTANADRCLWFKNEDYQNEIHHTNIILNKQKDSASYGLIYAATETTIKNSCIMENIGSPIFHNINGGFTIISSSLDENISSISGTLDTENKGSISFINGIYFLELGSCKATIDYLGSDVSISMEPSSIPKQKFTCFNLRKFDIIINIMATFQYTFLISGISTR